MVRIAQTFSLRLGFVPEVPAGLLDRHSGLRFRCRQSSAAGAITHLLRGDADVVRRPG
ncbi:hypothetical protein AB0K15_04515 [Amycolatopsis sp. NPDC049253]|uniref:hypothetical protein n=1 Tax=Amycolatopsis sp. NPDC049253 TaxID=3155274 RepID=UPI00342145A2